jgi:ubiquinone/menaquinone biosynthesis C-methylase UbiE
VGKGDTILDVGCGGGRTVSKLAAIATEGKVYGVDYSEESVAASKRINARRIDAGRVREVVRVLKPGGTLVLIAEVYGRSKTKTGQLAEKYASRTGLRLLNVEEHRKLLEEAGCSDVRIIEERGKGWICAIGRKALDAEGLRS